MEPEAAIPIKQSFGETPQIDYIFIDGGHFEQQILDDFNAVIPFLAPTGFI
ncbi:MAG: class I SAM-dependent methyltransferase, partial [Bacteroidia bacterium]